MSEQYSWTQPICTACWRERNPGRQPTTLRHPWSEICVHCGKDTVSGIYIRIDPAEAEHPTNLR